MTLRLQLTMNLTFSFSLIKSIVIILLFLPSFSSLTSLNVPSLCSTKCTDPNAKCIKQDNLLGQCKCDPGFDYMPIGFQLYCIKPIAIGSECAHTRECQLFDPNSTCSVGENPQICRCKPNHIYNFRKQCVYNTSKSINQSLRWLVSNDSFSRSNTTSSPKSVQVSSFRLISSITPNSPPFKSTTFTARDSYSILFSSRRESVIKNDATVKRILIPGFLTLVVSMVLCTKIVNYYNKMKQSYDSIQTENQPSSFAPSFTTISSLSNLMSSDHNLNTLPTHSNNMDTTMTNEHENRADCNASIQFSYLCVPTYPPETPDTCSNVTRRLPISLPTDDQPPSYNQVVSEFSVQIENWM